MFPLLAFLFFLSGASALTYQIVWLRTLSLIFGVTVYAASALLASFMAGLAVGSVLAGRIADRVRRPLGWFGAAELLISVTAFLSPFALEGIGTLYVALATDSQTPTAVTTARVVCSALVLLPPTILMGATLPLVLQSALDDSPEIGPRVSLLYGINTAGAIAGALVAGFVAIGSIGLTRTLQSAAVLNVVVGVTAILVARTRVITGASPHAVAATTIAVNPTGRPGPIVPIVFFLSGFTALALEIVWFRTLVLYFAATTYAFTSMLAMVLAGIALGSVAVSPVMQRWHPTLIWLGVLHAGIGIAVAAGFAGLAAAYDGGGALWDLAAGAAIAILPAAVLMGAAFPVGCRLWVASAAESGRRVGLLYSVNVAGAILGSLVGGFVLLPKMGSAGSLRLLAIVSVLMGIGMLLITARRQRAAAFLAIGLAMAFILVVRDLPDPFVTGLMKRYRDAGHIFMRDEGVQTTVSVHVRELGSRQLYLDGLHQASDGREVVKLHQQIGHLPVLLHQRPTRALVIGLGGGATAGAVSLHPGLSVDVVELAPGVVRAAQWFTHINENVLERPNVKVTIDDARNYLLLGRGKYDVITADIIQPTHAGAGLLYSQEYFALARDALTESGVMVQWIGPRSDLHYKLIARTFQSVFPETTVWENGSLLIGSVRALRLDPEAVEARLRQTGLGTALSAIGFGSKGLLAKYVAGPEALRRFLGEGPVLTDNHPLLEYYLSLPPADRPVDFAALRDH